MKPVAASLMALSCAFTVTGCGQRAEDKQKEYFKLYTEYLDLLDRDKANDVDIKKAVALRKRMMKFERELDALPEYKKRELDAKYREEYLRLMARQLDIMAKHGDKGPWLQLLIEGDAKMGR